MGERMVGSTTSDVIRLSYVPVMVIRLPEEASAGKRPRHRGKGDAALVPVTETRASMVE